MAQQGFTLTSPAFSGGGFIPSRYTRDGENRSPQLEWMHAPAGAKSFVVVLEDLDAETERIHWVRYDVSASLDGIPEAVRAGKGGRNDFHHHQYQGPYPPPRGGDRRYEFRLYALDVESLDLEPGAAWSEIESAMEGHVLGESRLFGLYRRSGVHA